MKKAVNVGTDQKFLEEEVMYCHSAIGWKAKIYSVTGARRDNVGWGNKEYYLYYLYNGTRVEKQNKVKFGSAVTVVIIVTVDFDLWHFPGRRSKDSYICYSDSITRFSGSRQCPRGYFSTAIGEPARNFFSRKVLHLTV
jgi:hypothetical protein